MAKRKTGSMLLGAIGKNKKEQMKALYPGNKLLKKATKSAPKITKSKNVSSSAKGTKATAAQMLARRRILGGVKDASKIKPGFKTGVVAGGAGAVGIGKYKNKRKEEAKDAADKLLKKQKEKKSRNK
tara:strand:+ start:58 stop:438 length:381 start_codon:yes stop_codon:yes gene_type:complete